MTVTWKVASPVTLIRSDPWVGSRRRARSLYFLCPQILRGEAQGAEGQRP